jgi:hypothetical protein
MNEYHPLFSTIGSIYSYSSNIEQPDGIIMSDFLEGKVAIITGGSGTIGKAIGM